MNRSFALLCSAICLALVADGQTLKNLSVKEGGTITLICTIKQHEDQCRWVTPEGRSLAHYQNSEKRYIITFKNNVCTLNITKAIFNDSGDWNCRGQKLATLTVTDGQTLKNLSVKEGGTITLNCTIKQHEDQCRWVTPEGTSLAHDLNPEKRYIITFKNKVCTLNITKAIFSDTGDWGCRGQKLATLTVTDGQTLKNLSVKEGGTITLNCTIKQHEDQCRWVTPEGTSLAHDLNPEKRYIITFKNKVCTLNITKAIFSDTGDWGCRGQKLATLTVTDGQTLKNLSVKEGGTITLNCIIKQHEDQCRWVTPEGTSLAHNLNPEKRYIIAFQNKVCTLNITKAIFSDTGDWDCRGQKLATLTVTAVPSQPYLLINGIKRITNVKAMISESSVNLSCVSSHGHPKPIAMIWIVNGKIVEGVEDANLMVEANGAITAITYLTLSMDQVSGYSLYNPDKEKKVTCIVEHITKNTTVTNILGNGYPTTKVELRASKPMIIGSDIIELSCDADGLPVPKSYKIINKSTGKTISEYQNTTTTKTGIYLCQVLGSNNKWMESKEVEITAEPARKSYLRYRLSDDEDYKSLNNEAVVLVQPGNIVYLECGSHSSNSIKIQWYKDDFIAKDDEENSAVSKARSTYRYTVPTADTCHPNGSHIKITCVIHYSHFTSDVIKIGATLGTQYKTTWVEIHYDEDVEEKTGNVVCKADGIPEPAYEIQLLEDNYAWTTVHCGRKGVVAQSGRYRCAATYVDPITKQKDTLTSKLFYEYHGRTPANYLMYALNDEVYFARLRKEAVIVVRPAEHVSLRCVSSNGRPKPTEIQWYEDGIFQRADTGKELHSEPAEYDTKAFTVWSLYNLSFPSRNDQSSNSVDRKGINEKKITCAIFHNGFTKGANKITAIFGEKYRTTSVETLYSESKDRKTGNIFCKADGIPEPMYDIQRHENKDVWISMHAGKNITITKRGSYRCAATYKDPDTHQVEEPIPSNLFYRYETS